MDGTVGHARMMRTAARVEQLMDTCILGKPARIDSGEYAGGDDEGRDIDEEDVDVTFYWYPKVEDVNKEHYIGILVDENYTRIVCPKVRAGWNGIPNNSETFDETLTGMLGDYLLHSASTTVA